MKLNMSENNYKVLFLYPNERHVSIVPPSLAILSAILKREKITVDLFDTSLYPTEGLDSDEIREKNLSVRAVKSSDKVQLKHTDKFTDFIMAAKDRRGRGIDDPWFDRETIDCATFTQAIDDIPFKTGGRVGFRLGGFGGKFTKAEVLIARLKNTLKDYAGKTDETSVYVNETFPNFIKEIEANPKLAENEHVWKALGMEGLPKDQRLVVHGDNTVDFFRQTSGPGNIDRITAFLEKHPLLTREEAIRIMKMEPEDRILEITRLETIRRTPNASGGLAQILEV